ncbi:MAG: primosomal protein N' [Erysipelotrichaceae bacterium]|jgi:primosomal protein N' (replication factor Y)|nr:primosomal protein N' [Erysipelotrichaceae bacterium]
MYLLTVLLEIRSLDQEFSYTAMDDLMVQVGMRILVNFGPQKLVGFVIRSTKITDLSETEKTLGYELKPILGVIDKKPILSPELIKLARQVADYYLTSLISVLQSMLPLGLKPNTNYRHGPKEQFATFYEFILFDNAIRLTPKQQELLDLLKSVGRLPKKMVKPTMIKPFLEHHYVRAIKEKITSTFKSEVVLDYVKPQLTEEQALIVEKIHAAPRKTYLLHGVTGSGKTEVYLALTEEYLRKKQSVIILVPEISLTPQMFSILWTRFKDQVSILHSGLTPKERYEQYLHIKDTPTIVVVGTRSAVFAPVNNLGLIVIDEEHVESYKQDVTPRYHAREVAKFRVDMSGATLLLGSATPSLYSYSRARKGLYQLLELKQRINEIKLPRTELIDLHQLSNLDDQSSLLSLPLRQKMKVALDNREQIILLINKRGYASFVTCRNCGFIISCPHDGYLLTYHKADRLLKCHHCEHVELWPDSCPNCLETTFASSSFGTERIEEEVRRFFPEARIARFDSDSTKTKTALSRIIKGFNQHEFDILIGTQMLSKGHDFSRVSLVGVVLADYGLNNPSFMSGERTFDLICQAIGRAGRKYQGGTALIQTYNPRHPALIDAVRQDYQDFYLKEMMLRKLRHKPPYTFLIMLTLCAKELLLLEDFGGLLQSLLRTNASGFTVSELIKPYHDFMKDTFYRKLLLTYKTQVQKDEITQIIKSITLPRKLTLSLDVDPSDDL